MNLAIYLTPEQVEIEYNIPRQTLANNRWRSKGIPYVKLGRKILYLRDDVQQALASHRVAVRGEG